MSASVSEELLDFFAQGRRVFGPKIRGWISVHGFQAPFRFPADPSWRAPSVKTSAKPRSQQN
jgi:hypothetical protein